MSLDFQYVIPHPLVDIFPVESHEGVIGVAKELVEILGVPAGANVYLFWSLCLSVWNARKIVQHTRLLSYGPGGASK